MVEMKMMAMMIKSIEVTANAVIDAVAVVKVPHPRRGSRTQRERGNGERGGDKGSDESGITV